MKKLAMHSKDMTQENLAKIQAAFPNCITESKDENGNIKLSVDFDLLRQELADHIVEGPQERYRLDWPGKREAMLLANAPIAKTLRPVREESVDFDHTKNLFIEGDNLEALKLLQENYLGKVKMIYIDPPYNTGKDFIYSDSFSESPEEYFERSNQVDEEGNRLVANTDSSGRLHSDWLSMMLPRLRLARNLLGEDGVIFISIDENEFSNLKKICDEIFGSINYVSELIWQNKTGGGNDSKYCAVEHEYLLIYAKNKMNLSKFFEKYSDEYLKRYKEEDSISKYYWDTFKRRSGKQYYPIECPDGTVLQYDEFENPISWLRSEGRFKNDLKIGDVKFEKRQDGWSVMFKQRLPEGKKPRSLVLDKGTTSDGNNDVTNLFKTTVFSNPKPVTLLEYIFGISTDTDDIILDFFAGSATTAQATMSLNATDGGHRKYILVQYPEVLDETKVSSTEAKNTIKNAKSILNELDRGKVVTEISKERIRRAGKQILDGECHQDWNKDVGFRVLKVDTSNMKDVYYRPQDISQETLFDFVDNIKDDRTSEDLLFQVLLESAAELNAPIRRETIQGKEVFFVNDNDLIACFDNDITEALINELATHQPLRVVFRDSGFADNSVKTNVTQIFKQLSEGTEVRSI